MEELICANESCASRRWTRQKLRGRKPMLCPKCSDKFDSIELYTNRIIRGDALSLLRRLPDESVNLVICSPPYFNQRTYTEDDCELGRESSIEEYLRKLLAIFRECVRVTSIDGSIVFNLGDKHIDNDLQLVPWQFAIEARKIVKLINEVTWVKTDPTPRQYTGRMVSATEPFFHFIKSAKYKYFPDRLSVKKENKNSENSNTGISYFRQIESSDLSSEQKEMAKIELQKAIDDVRSGKLFTLRMKIRGIHTPAFGGQEGGRKAEMDTKGYSVIRCPGNSMLKDYIISPVANIKGGEHPAVYPTHLVETFIKLTTNENDIVLDPFMGSGTTAIAAKNLSRRYIGFDLSEKFVHDANSRISNMPKELELIKEAM